MSNAALLADTSDLDFDLDLDVRISDAPAEETAFGSGGYTSPSTYSVQSRCPLCCA